MQSLPSHVVVPARTDLTIATGSETKPAAADTSPSPPPPTVRMPSTAINKRNSARASLRESLRARSSSVELFLSEVRSAFDPNSRAIQLWHQALLVCLIYEIMMLPYIAVFRRAHGQWLIPEFLGLYTCELLFCADIYVELNTGYYEDGNVMLDASKARVRYVKSARFLLDVLALPPLSLIVLPTMPHSLGATLIFLEFHKLLRIWRLPKYVAMLDDIYARHFVVLKMFKVLLVTVMLSHFVACFRFMFGYDTHHNNHWLPHVEAEDGHEEHHLSPYLRSLFWAFGLLTGLFEGELPTTILEFVFTIFVALCGFSLFTYLCATFFMISKCESGHVAAAEARINQLKHLLSFHHVPETLQVQAVEYLTRYYTQSESNDRDAMRLLCPSISKDIQVELLKEMVGNILFFRECNHRFIIAITSLLEMISLPANMIVFSAGDEGDAMYVVNSGVLHVMVRGIKIRELRKGAFFGEMALFLKRPRYATVMTSTYCTLYKLVRFHVERVLEGYPEYATLIPKRVEEMARALFGRVSGEALIIPDENMIASEPNNAANKPAVFARLIRKHMKKDLSKVAPSTENPKPRDPAAVASPSPMLQLARAALRQKRETPSEVATTVADVSVAPSDDVLNQDSLKDKDLPRPPTETSPADRSGAITPLDRRRSSSSKVTKAMSEIYSQVGWSATRIRKRYWWSRALLGTAIDPSTNRRMWWLALMQVVLIYNWFLIPLQSAFIALRDNTWYIVTLNVITDLLLWGDMYVNLNLSFVHDSEKIWDTTRTAQRYITGWFVFDFLCVFPYWFFAQTAHHAIPRVPRLLRVFRLSGHFQELDAFTKLTSRQRLLLFGVLLIVLYHIVACLYFSITYLEGFSPAHKSWIPSDDVYLVEYNSTHFVDRRGNVYSESDPFVTKMGTKQYFRALYYATNVLAALGLTIEPVSDTQFGMALIFMLSGFFITAIVVDNVQKRFTASAVDQKEFFATRSHIQLFLRRQNAPLVIHKRVNAFLDFWWSSHRGAVINELLEELPERIKHEILQSICQAALQTLALLNGVRPVLEDLERVFLDNAKFILYGQGEVVYRQGDYASGLFFLLSGEICIITNGGAPRTIHQGGFFGVAALQVDGNAVSYSERVSATSGCVVLYVSREHIRAMKGVFSSLEDSFKALEKRLLDPKLAKASAIAVGNSIGDFGDSRSKWLRWLVCWRDNDYVFDPDSMQMLAWETWLFIAMTIEWIVIMFDICYGVSGHRAATTDSILVIIELHFVVDVYVRSHLGYYEFGNKVMVPKRIRAKYFRSLECAVDLLALLPFFMFNWGSASAHRNEILNLNKMLRLSKVPTQFTALENKYLKRTLEVRLFKLVYYTFLLTHILGSIWFDFASNSSGLHSLATDGSSGHRALASASRFGSYEWMPPTSLEHASEAKQYFASLFWSFGLMSASSTGDLPKTVPQSIFSVVTMTCGFFLFAYVIGNFSDTIELMDAENREFYAKLNQLRHLLKHFKFPHPIGEKFKNYFFFKRFHSITQEHLLERCLPPSLLTDIRMVHLQPMIDKVTFLSGMEASVTRMLVSQFSQVLIVKDEFVYRFGEEGSDMYFVFTGVLCTMLPHEEYIRDSSVIERKGSLLASMLAPDGSPDAAQSPTTSPRGHKTSSNGHKVRVPTIRTNAHLPQLSKLNDITEGNYFGENALFVNSVRTSYVQASTSCILYRLSRHSLELVFERYPDWKTKVLRIVTINQEQQRLNRLAHDEEKNAAILKMVAHVDQVNDRAERTEEELRVFRRTKSVSGKRKTSQGGASIQASMEKVNVSREGLRMPQWVLEFTHGTHAQSWYHLAWLKLICFATIYVSVIVPYRISFDSLQRPTWLSVLGRELELVCEGLFLWDIWFNWRLKGSRDSMELYEQDHRQAYKKERLRWDLVAAFPLDYILYSMSPSPWYRLNRCLKVRNLMHYLHEINRRSISNEMHRLRSAFLMYMLMIYWSACSYFVIAIYDQYGNNWNAWLPSMELKISQVDDPPSKQLMLRLLRGLFYATTAFVKKGRTFTPESTAHFVFAIMTSFVGLLIMAFMIGEIASLFISYIGNEVEYRKNHIAVELYLGRWKIHGNLKVRTQAFLSSLWSSHRGVDYQALLEEVPTSIRTESILNIARWPLRSFTNNVFRPICRGSQDSEQQGANMELLMQALARHLKFEGYPRNELVIVEGSISKAMYFVVRGSLQAMSRSHTALFAQSVFVKGDYFGESGLLAYSVSAFTVNTMRACDLLSLSSESLLEVLHAHPTFGLALKLADSAADRLKVMPLANNTRTMEIRWGQALIDVVNEERQLYESPEKPVDPLTRRHWKKSCAIIDRYFVTRTADECFGSFRPFLQIIVPNGFLHLHGIPSSRQLMKQRSARTSTTFTNTPDGGSMRVEVQSARRLSVKTPLPEDLTKDLERSRSGYRQESRTDSMAPSAADTEALHAAAASPGPGMSDLSKHDASDHHHGPESRALSPRLSVRSITQPKPVAQRHSLII